MSGPSSVRIDADRCMGSGNCAFWAPGTFDLGDDGVAIVIGDPATAADHVRLAAEHCPTEAIAVELAGDGSSSDDQR